MYVGIAAGVAFFVIAVWLALKLVPTPERWDEMNPPVATAALLRAGPFEAYPLWIYFRDRQDFYLLAEAPWPEGVTAADVKQAADEWRQRKEELNA